MVVVVVVRVVDAMVLPVDVLRVVVSLDVVVMFHCLAAVVHSVVVVVVMVGSPVSRVVLVLVFQTDAHVGAILLRRFRHDTAIGRFLVAVVKVAECRVGLFGISGMLPIRYQDQTFLSINVDTFHVSNPVTLHNEHTNVELQNACIIDNPKHVTIGHFRTKKFVQRRLSNSGQLGYVSTHRTPSLELLDRACPA